MADQNHANPQDDRRKWDRVELKSGTDVTANAGDENYDATIVDLSMGGAKLEFDEQPDGIDDVAIHHESLGRLTGNAVWQKKKTVGVKFRDDEVEKNAKTGQSCP